MAQRLLAQFRMDYSKNINKIWYNELVSRLNEASDEFRRWWPDYDIAGDQNGIKEVCYPQIGTFFLRHNCLQTTDHLNLKVIIVD